MASTVYRTPIVLSADGKNHVPAQSGEKLDPNSIPIDSSLGNLLKPGENGLTLSPDDLISKEPNNSLVLSSSDGKLKVDANKLVASNDPLLSVADNKIKSTLTVELTNAGQLILKGVGGKTVGSVTLPVVPGLPTVAEFLTNYTPQNSAGVIGGGGKGNYLHLQFAMSNGTTKDLYINYTAMLSGGGNSSTTNPSDLIVPGGGLVVDGNKLKVNCADLKTCINTTVSGNFLADGGLTSDANGKFKVDWTKAPSDSSGGGLSIGTKIGEYTRSEIKKQSGTEEWVLTDVAGGKPLFIVVQSYEAKTVDSYTNSAGGAVGGLWYYYLLLKRPFVSYTNNIEKVTDSTFSPSDVSDLHQKAYCGRATAHTDASFKDEINYIPIAPVYSLLSEVQAGGNGLINYNCQSFLDVSSNVFMFLPDKAYSTLTLTLMSRYVLFKLESYQ